MARDLYAVLGVASTSSEREIRHAFHELARKYHPDVAVGDPHAARKFVEVSQAAETLLDPRRRAEYDRHRTPSAPPSAPPRPPPPAWTAPAATPAQTRPRSKQATGYKRSRGEAGTITLVAICAVAAIVRLVVAIVSTPPADRVQGNQGPAANGTVLWKATGYRMDDGWGINLAGSGRRIQIYPGTSADLEVDSGYLSSGGHIVFLPPGTPPSYQGCFIALLLASNQSEPLDAIMPGINADLCSSGSTGDIAFVHVTGKSNSSLVMDITIWHDI
jgi:DnaJ-like protein